jgi:hypothetical protein
MLTLLERARGFTLAAYRQAHRQLDVGVIPSAENAALARTLASQTATTGARHANAIVGIEGFEPDGAAFLDGSRFRPEKLARDADEYASIRRAAASRPRRRAVHTRERRSAAWAL